jgi:hypothetical protein
MSQIGRVHEMVCAFISVEVPVFVYLRSSVHHVTEVGDPQVL